MSDDFSAMATRIQDEVDRSTSGDTTAIKREIISSIEALKYTRFWFSEDTFTITTASGTDEYAFPVAGVTNPTITVLEVDSLIINNSNSLQRLRQVSFPWLDAMKANTLNTGVPIYWASHHNKIRLYPIPNATYTITGQGFVDFNTLTAASSGSSATNAWMTIAEEAIRTRAKGALMVNQYKDYAGAAQQIQISKAAVDVLLRETSRRLMAPAAMGWW